MLETYGEKSQKVGRGVLYVAVREARLAMERKFTSNGGSRKVEEYRVDRE
jgi:hypothetical protein